MGQALKLRSSCRNFRLANYSISRGIIYNLQNHKIDSRKGKTQRGVYPSIRASKDINQSHPTN